MFAIIARYPKEKYLAMIDNAIATACGVIIWRKLSGDTVRMVLYGLAVGVTAAAGAVLF